MPNRLHEQACSEGREFYTDPDSGLMVGTRLRLLRRGYCCGSGCRHCPYEPRHQKGGRSIRSEALSESKSNPWNWVRSRSPDYLEKAREQGKPFRPGFLKLTETEISSPESRLFRIQYLRIQKCDLWPEHVLVPATFQAAAMGPPGFLHGGFSAALLDEVLGSAAWELGFACVTQKLELDYLHPVPLAEPALGIAWLASPPSDSSPSLDVLGGLFALDGTLLVQGRGRFHRIPSRIRDKASP